MDDRARFIGRTAELDYNFQRILGLRHGATPQRCLVNIHGVYGSGKSALLGELARRAAEQPGLLCLSLRLSPLPDAHRSPTLEARQAILRQLGAADPPPDEVAADAALAALVAELLGRRAPVLLLIDAASHSALTSFGWVERGLLLPLVRAERLVAVITSRSPLRWRELDTRRRAETRALDPLTVAETSAQLGVDALAAARIHALTVGLPLANEVARAQLREQPDPAGWDALSEAALARRIVEQIYARVEPTLTSELRCALEVLAVVREFAIPLMQTLLSFCDAPGQARSQALQLVMVRQLQDLDLVVWEHASASWRLVPVLRHLIAEQLRRNDPERYRAIQRVACNYYRQMLDEVLVSRHIHLAELLWHTLDSQGASGKPAPDLLRDLMRDYLFSPDGRQTDQITIAALRARLVANPELPAALRDHEPELEALVTVLDQAVAARV
jgi:hypothetical protein